MKLENVHWKGENANKRKKERERETDRQTDIVKVLKNMSN